MTKTVAILIATIVVVTAIGVIILIRYPAISSIPIGIATVIGGLITLTVAVYQLEKRERMLYREKHYDLKAEAFKEITRTIHTFRRFLDTTPGSGKLSDVLNDVRTAIYSNKPILSKDAYHKLDEMLKYYSYFVMEFGDQYRRKELRKYREQAEAKFKEFEGTMKKELKLEDEREQQEL